MAYRTDRSNVCGGRFSKFVHILMKTIIGSDNSSLTEVGNAVKIIGQLTALPEKETTCELHLEFVSFRSPLRPFLQPYGQMEFHGSRWMPVSRPGLMYAFMIRKQKPPDCIPGTHTFRMKPISNLRPHSAHKTAFFPTYPAAWFPVPGANNNPRVPVPARIPVRVPVMKATQRTHPPVDIALLIP